MFECVRLDQEQQGQEDPFIWYQSKLQAMVQEKRNGVAIGVLSDNVREIQQQIDEQANTIGVIGASLERMETSFASLQALLEERLPWVQTPPQEVQGGQTPINQPRQPVLKVQIGQGILIGDEARNAMPMRPPT